MPTAQPTRESKNEETISAAQDRPLKESLADASVLLWYATREGKEVAEKSISDIVLAQSSLSAGTRDPEVESRFWAALRALAAAVKPASVDSILATYSYPFGDYHDKTGKRCLVDATATKKHYTWAAVGVLIGLLIIQMYWFVGTTFRADLEVNRAELDGIAGALRVRSVELLHVVAPAEGDAKTIDLVAATATASASLPDFPDVDPALVKFIADLDPKEQLRVLALLDVENKTTRSHRVVSMLKSESEMLQGWDIVTKLENFVKMLIGILPDAPDHDQMKSEHALMPELPVCVDGCDELRKKYEKAQNDIEIAFQPRAVEIALFKSKWILAILSQYVLPLLYGTLGALAYILRTLSNEIQSVTFTRGSEIRYSLRWPLGMLGGVTVGLFFDPAHLSGFAAVTPLGLAFLAGYGVELLFTGLDGMVGAFTGGSTARPKAT